MSLLESVLEHCAPAQWEYATYTSQMYHLFELKPGDDEYEEEVKLFEIGTPHLTVKTLQRYQNPYLLGRFEVRKEQLLYRRETVHEFKYYHAVSKSDLPTALEYNMDVRRYSYNLSCSIDNKNPKFYQTPDAAYRAHSGTSDKAILICKVLSERKEHTTYKTNDAEFLPIYVAKLY